jgi:sarcosine oxidase subunit gamma
LWLGPGRWLLGLPARAQRPQAPGLSVVDLSHGRWVLRLAGPAARTVLAGGCLLDLSADGLPPGRCAQTLLFRVPVLLHAVAAETVDLYAPRSYALALWEHLMAESLPHGLQVGPA